jgi:hypothetical protein
VGRRARRDDRALPGGGGLTSVVFHAPRRVGRTIGYQKYYLLGFEEAARLRVRGLPLVPGVRAKISLAYRLGRGDGEAWVGRYDCGGVRFAIDAHDRREVKDPEALAWADVYFKANRWPGDSYDPKVLPVVNGNGLLDRAKIEHLRSLRDAPKEVDVAYVSNVWGGREHSLRVFERLAGLDCSKDLLAIFPEGFPAEEDAEGMERLRARGIPVTREPVPPRELWRRLARARLVPMRAGKHLCWSWRTIDLLAMGACIVFDALPPPRWPVPIEPGAHVADCGVARPDDTEAAVETEYDKVPATIEALLGWPDEQAGMRRAAAAYFDEHAAPARVAEHLLATTARAATRR